MKTTKFLLGALAAFSFAGISCQREEPIVEQPPEEVHMTLIASSDDETRSILQPDGQTVLWGADEQLHVFETIYGPEAPSTIQRASSIGTSSDGGVTMSFGVSFPTNVTGTSYVYNAVYPNSAYVSGNDNKDPTNLRVITPSTQKATATSFDGDADLLIAKQVTETSQPSSITLGFKRMLVVGKMTLNNIASEANVKSVKFSSPNKKITGRSTMNLTTGEAIEYGYNSEDYVEVTYEDNIPANGLTVFFTCFPFQIAAGENFTVEVMTKDNKKFTKAVTIPENRSLSFELGKNTVFSVSMDGIAPETVDNLAGKQYVILAKDANKYYYMSSTLSTTSTKYYLYGEPEPSVAADAQVDFTNSRTNFPNVTDFWEIEECNDNYAIKSVTTGKYISWSSGNSAAGSDSPYELTISAGSNGLYRVASKTAPSRLLEYNSSSPRFAFYENTQSDLYLIPVGPADSRIPLAEVTPTVTQEGNTMNVIVSWTGVDHAASYTVSIGDQSQTIQLAPDNQYQQIFTVPSYGNYEVTVTANPESGYKASVATTSISVVEHVSLTLVVEGTSTSIGGEVGQPINELLPNEAPVCSVSGYTFTGWTTSEYAEAQTTEPSYVETTTTLPAGGLTIYAVFAKQIQMEVGSSTITYDKNDFIGRGVSGGGSSSSFTYTEDGVSIVFSNAFEAKDASTPVLRIYSGSTFQFSSERLITSIVFTCKGTTDGPSNLSTTSGGNYNASGATGTWTLLQGLQSVLFKANQKVEVKTISITLKGGIVTSLGGWTTSPIAD